MWRLVLLSMLAACYSPVTPPGARCMTTEQCPLGQDCVGELCQLPGAPVLDAAPDAEREPDAPPTLDDDGDGVMNAVDNCAAVANPNQANEDGDRSGDACDACPQIAEATLADGDSDGIGDACDPNPTTKDIVWLFEGFHEAIPPSWDRSSTTNWVAVDGAAQVNADGTGDSDGEYLSLPIFRDDRAFDNFSIAVTVTLEQLNGQDEHDFGISMYDLSRDREPFCELAEFDSPSNRAIVLGEVTSSSIQKEVGVFAWGVGVTYRLAMTRNDQGYTCLVVGPNSSQTLTLTPAAIPTSNHTINAFGTRVRFGSVFVVGPPP